MWLISRAAPLLHFDVRAHSWIAAALVFAGFVTGISGVMTFLIAVSSRVRLIYQPLPNRT
jgi:hypothetical protein